MPYIIAISGLPGSGKTTLAQAMAAGLDARHFNTDIIRQKLGLRGQYDPEAKKAIYEEMLRQTKSCISAGERVVVDATFYQRSLRACFESAARQLHVPIYWIEVRAIESVVRQRVRKHREYSEADYRVYCEIRRLYEPFRRQPLILRSDLYPVHELVRQARARFDL